MPENDQVVAQQPRPLLVWFRNVGVGVFGIALFISIFLLFGEQGPSWFQKFWMIVGLLAACGVELVSYLGVLRARNNPTQSIPAVVIFDSISFLIGGLVVASFWTASDPRSWAATIMWSFACLALGGLTGFLFGVPRSRSIGQSRVVARPQQNGPGVVANQTDGGATDNSPIRESTGDESPIEQISDWLTKIIVGLGLANLKELPGQIDRWANYVAGSVSPGSAAAISPAPHWNAAGPSFAVSLILYFCVLGFMSCYILTQMFLLEYINRMRAG